MENIVGVPLVVFGIFLMFWRKIIDLVLYIFIPERVEMDAVGVITKDEVVFRVLNMNDNLTPVFYDFDVNRKDGKRKLLKFFYVKTWYEQTGEYYEIEVPPNVYETVKNKISMSDSVVKFPCRKLSWWFEFFY